MAIWDAFMRVMALEPWDHPPLQTRSASTLEDFASRLTSSMRTPASPWRVASVGDALSVPAIFRAVTFISNIIGSLSMRAFRDGEELEEAARPRLIVRPNPFTIPREFGRETGWAMASYGEAWWWVAARDGDGLPMSLLPVHPREVRVEDNPADPRYPLIDWRGRRMRNSDMVQIKMTGEPGALRGRGPLQMCGAAVSVSVEAQEWAANFFAEGGVPSIWVKTAVEMSDEDVDAFQTQWAEKAHNVPRFTDPGVEDIKDVGVNQQGAQMLSAREFQTGEAARMFGIPGTLLDHAVPGSSLTYQNVGQEFDKFVRSCLLPDYLEPIEQAMSDLLPRSTVTRFNTEALLRADLKTRYEVATLGLEKNVHDRDEARQIIGLAPSVENAAVPFSPPQAFPTPSQLPTSDSILTRSAVIAPPAPKPAEIRCTCGKLLAELASAPYRFTCPRCKTVAVAA